MAMSFWVVMQKRIGKDAKVYADLHKTDEKIYLTKEDAEAAQAVLPGSIWNHVVELVALTREEWDELSPSNSLNRKVNAERLAEFFNKFITAVPVKRDDGSVWLTVNCKLQTDGERDLMREEREELGGK